MAQSSDRLATRLEALIVGLQGVANALKSQRPELSAATVTRIEKFREERRCLCCELPLEGETRRGCHQSCYNNVRNRIRRGELTEIQAIEQGRITPADAKSGRKSGRPDPFRIGEAVFDLSEKQVKKREQRRERKKHKAP